MFHNFFAEEVPDALLRYAASNESRFYETGIKARLTHDTSIRKSLAIRDLGPFRDRFEESYRALLPRLIASLSVGRFILSTLVLELVAHCDGAFYRRHIDTFTGEDAPGPGYRQRVISGVYYFHSQPKRFSGGELYLYPLAADASEFVAIQPEHNSLVVFPSWAAHEVRPVSCPSGQFADSRFAVNCWFCRETPAVTQNSPSADPAPA